MTGKIEWVLVDLGIRGIEMVNVISGYKCVNMIWQFGFTKIEIRYIRHRLKDRRKKTNVGFIDFYGKVQEN